VSTKACVLSNLNQFLFPPIRFTVAEKESLVYKWLDVYTEKFLNRDLRSALEQYTFVMESNQGNSERIVVLSPRLY
jgi:hypothetical protein